MIEEPQRHEVHEDDLHNATMHAENQPKPTMNLILNTRNFSHVNVDIIFGRNQRFKRIYFTLKCMYVQRCVTLVCKSVQ